MGILTTLTYNGKELDPRVFRVEHLPDYTIPQRDLQATHVEGRSGDVVIDSKSYKNIPRSYNVSFAAAGPEDFAAKVSEISKWLDAPGYAPLYDTYEKDYYRMAYPSGSYKVQSILNGQAGKVTIDFSCIPKRYLVYGRDGLSWARPVNSGSVTPFSAGDVDGDGYITINDADMALNAAVGNIQLTQQQFNAADVVAPLGTITAADAREILSMANAVPAERFALYNPTEYDTFPVFRCLVSSVGKSAIYVSESLYKPEISTAIELNVPAGTDMPLIVVIDCERENVYNAFTVENLNSLAIVKNGYPKLYAHKNNAIQFTGGIDVVTVYPNFWVR